MRAVNRSIPQPVGTLHGFLLAGEIGPKAALLSLPAHPDQQVGIYVPLPKVPPHAQGATVVCYGVISYWAPHAVGKSGAMGELAFKVARVNGQIEPMVLLWRGSELVVFVYSTGVAAGSVQMQAMRRDFEQTEQAVGRVACEVIPTGVPALSETLTGSRS